jgi:hypothetical protein
MTRALLAAFCATCFVLTSGSVVKATEQARKACCTEMGGSYGDDPRDRRAICRGIARGSGSIFVACVQRKIGGGGMSQKK